MQISIFRRPGCLGGWFARATIGGLINDAKDIEFPVAPPFHDIEPFLLELAELMPFATIEVDR